MVTLNAANSMLQYLDTYVGLQEIPGEVSLVIILSDYVFQCRGKKAQMYKSKEGKPLTKEEFTVFIDSLIGDITCVTFMGGDIAPDEINDLATFVRIQYPDLRIGWYSSDESITVFTEYQNFDYIKLGPYNQRKGGLRPPKTNQRLYKVEGAMLRDITHLFQK